MNKKITFFASLYSAEDLPEDHYIDKKEVIKKIEDFDNDDIIVEFQEVRRYRISVNPTLQEIKY